MSSVDYEQVKKEIRSLLISYQRGTSLSEFQKEYRQMIGRPLPWRELHFKDELYLLKSMPDAVTIFDSPVRGDYHLMGVADNSVKHIQNMVVKQKPTKHRTSYRVSRREPPFREPNVPRYRTSTAPRYARTDSYNWVPPPRASRYVSRSPTRPNSYGPELPAGVDRYVIDMLEEYPNGLKLNMFLETFSIRHGRMFKFKDWGYHTLEECLETISGLNATTVNNEIFVHLTKYVLSKKTNVRTSESFNIKAPVANTNSRMVNSEESKSHFFNPHNSSVTNGNKTSNLVSNKDYMSSNYLLNKSTSYTPYHQEVGTEKKSQVDTLDSFKLVDIGPPSQRNVEVCQGLNKTNNMNSLDPFGPLSNETDEPSVPVTIRYNLQCVIEKYPRGIIAVDFPKFYNLVTKSSFDLHELGFNSLAELVDAVPDIMVRKPINGSKKNWLICPTGASEELFEEEIYSGKSTVHFVESVILNTRKLLQANPEGIKLGEFFHVYGINCEEPFYFKDLGFDSLENFLLSIAERVPLKIITDEHNYGKVIVISEFNQVMRSSFAPPIMSKPPDTAPVESNFMELKLPTNFDYSKFIPIYTSSIANPGLIYIQLQGEQYSGALSKLYDKIDDFYNSESSGKYKMKPKDIWVGASCIAFWPVDNHWYRAKIIGCLDSDIVKVFYIDYATTDEISTDLLRYIKLEYMGLPCQALRARLAYLKPPNNSTQWDKITRKRLLELCQDVPLMAKVEDIQDDVLSLILCDTNGADDLYINDVLTVEKLADIEDSPEESKPKGIASDIIKCLADVVHTTPDNLQRALQNLSLNSANNFAPPGFVTQPMAAIPPLQIPTMPLQVPMPTVPLYVPLVPNTVNAFETNVIKPPVYNYGLHNQMNNTAAEPISSPNKDSPSSSSPIECDVFSDADDELFDQICNEYLKGSTNARKCYVKRIKTSDKYIFHVLFYDSKLYISAGDISVLIWSSKKPFQLLDRLAGKDIVLPSLTVVEDGNEEFFHQLERFDVKGVQRYGSDHQQSVLLYPLQSVNKILNLFGHPSAALRAKIKTESLTFNPTSPYWLEYSDSAPIEPRDDERSETDDDKLNIFNRMCLHDLKIMKDGIKFKRMQLGKKEALNATGMDKEINKLNQLFAEVRDRIKEIEQICQIFSSES